MKWSFWLVGGTVILVALVAVFVPAIRDARKSARRAYRRDSLAQVAVALHNFNHGYEYLPPAVSRDETGRPLSSWRFRLLVYVEGIMIWPDFADRWDAPANRWLNSRPYWVYCFNWATGPSDCQTTVVAVTGRGTAFEDGKVVRLADLDKDTILLIEMASSGIHWMEPGDLDVAQVAESITEGLDGRGVFVVFADGAVWFLHRDVPLDDLKKFFTIEGAKRYDRDQVLKPYAIDWR